MRGSKDQLRRPIAPGAYVRQVRLPLLYYLGGSEVANHCIFPLQQDIVRFYVSMTDPTRVDVHEPPENLVRN